MESDLPELFSERQWLLLVKAFRLTPRQLEVARIICLGCTNGQIAKRLGISIATVRLHAAGIYIATGARSRVGIVVLFVLATRQANVRKKRLSKPI